VIVSCSLPLLLRIMIEATQRHACIYARSKRTSRMCVHTRSQKCDMHQRHHDGLAIFIQAAVLLTLFTLSKCTTLTIVSICRVSAWFFSLSLSSSDVACLVLTRHRSVLSSSLQPTLQQRQINTFSFLFYTKNGMTEFDFQK
jgi:hypothetical protein